jgi:hypothetical protein
MFRKKPKVARRQYMSKGGYDSWFVMIERDEVALVRLDVFEDLCALAGYVRVGSEPSDAGGGDA